MNLEQIVPAIALIAVLFLVLPGFISSNSNKILFSILYDFVKIFPIRICEINGGGLRNAIPRESSVIIIFDKMVTIGARNGRSYRTSYINVIYE